MGIKIIVWSLLSYGITTIVVYGKIFEPFRKTIKKWGKRAIFFQPLWRFISELTSCPLCFGTWAGFFLGVFIFSPTHELFEAPKWSSWFFDGLFSAGIVWVINSIVEFFEENRINLK